MRRGFASRGAFALIFAVLSAGPTFAETKPMTVDPEYSDERYRHFSFFSLVLFEDPSTHKKALHLRSQIIESDRYTDGNQQKDPRPFAKKAFRRLKLYFNEKYDQPQVEMDLTPLKLDSPLDPGLGSATLHDGKVVCSIEIPLPGKALQLFKKRKPATVRAVFYDQAGRVVSFADLDGPAL